jgi:hypothetical protein
MNFSHIPHGHLTEGTATDLGTIEAVSLTAYRIGGRWVAFQAIHGPYRPATPLVSFG